MSYEVEEIPGELFCYRVSSNSRPGQKHRVELEDYRWNGSCACEAFGFRYRKELENGSKPSNSLRCEHIKAARAHVLDNVLPKLAVELRKKRAPECEETETVAAQDNGNPF